MRQSFWIFPVVVATAGAMTWTRYRHHAVVAISSAPKGQVQALTADAKIKWLIKKNLSDIMDCYNERLQHGLNREGDLKIAWEIDAQGVPSHFAEMGNDLDDSELYDCSAEAISQWDFPAGQPFFVHYTFHLKQKSKQEAAASDRAVASTDELNETMPLPLPSEQNHDAKDSQ